MSLPPAEPPAHDATEPAPADVLFLALVEVAPADRVRCQAPGCGHSIYRRIHVLRDTDGIVRVYGADCFERLFQGRRMPSRPHVGSGEARRLSAEERELLIARTEELVARITAEYEAAQRAAESARAAASTTVPPTLPSTLPPSTLPPVDTARSAAPPRPPSAEALARVEAEAKALARQRHGIDPDAPGWRGLVLTIARELLRQGR